MEKLNLVSAIFVNVVAVPFSGAVRCYKVKGKTNNLIDFRSHRAEALFIGAATISVFSFSAWKKLV